MTIGFKIRKARMRKGLKQYELANEAHISNTYLSDIEKDRVVPSVKTLLNISAILKVDCSELLPNYQELLEQQFNLS